MLRALAVAKNWNLDPKRWRELSADDRGRMMAHDNYEAIVEAYREEWREAHKGKSGRSGAQNDYEAMKKRLGLE